MAKKIKKESKFVKTILPYMPGKKTRFKKQDFWVGLLHGLLLPISFIFGQFLQDVKVYESKSKKGSYDAGYIIGIIILVKIIIF